MARTVSTWDWQALEYQYWTCPGTDSPGGWDTSGGAGESDRPPTHRVGYDIEDLLPPLPRGCTKGGRGVRAKGRIARPPRVLGAGMGGSALAPTGPSGWRVLGYVAAAAVGVLALRQLVRKGR